MSTTAPPPAPPPAAPTSTPYGAFQANPAQAAAPQAAAPSSPLSITSLVLGLVSIFAGWTFFAPAAGLVTGILALGREPHSRTMAIWGIVLNAVMLAGSIIVALIAIIAGIAALPFLPFALFW